MLTAGILDPIVSRDPFLRLAFFSYGRVSRRNNGSREEEIRDQVHDNERVTGEKKDVTRCHRPSVAGSLSSREYAAIIIFRYENFFDSVLIIEK